MKNPTSLFFCSLGAAGITLWLTITGCSSRDGESEEGAAESDVAGDFTNAAEVEQYYADKVSIPPEELEALERSEITQEEMDVKIAAGAYPKFFQFASTDEIPDTLVWENGMDLPDIGSPKAKKGGTRYGYIRDFPRTLRLVGPDSNGSFRPYILDDVTVGFANRHPNITTIGPNGFLHYPGLAEAWAVDKPSKTIYVKIDPTARWSDREQVTVEDVFFLFFFFQSKYIRAPWYNNWYNRNYTNVTRYDDLTFSISVPESKPDMLSRVLGLHPVPRHFFGDLGEDFVERYQWEFQPTTGPYVVEEKDIKKGRSIALTRQKDWWARDKKFWRNRFNYDRIRLTVIRDTAKAFETFRKGELDGFGMSLPEYHYEKLPDSSDDVQNGHIHKFTFYNVVPRPTYGLWINLQKPTLDNRDLRVGINYATNWQLVIDEYFRGDYARMRTTADGYGEFSHPTLRARPFDVGKALEHFAAAGFSERGADGILQTPSGQRLSFTLSTGYEALKDTLTILKEEAANAGLEYRLEVLDGTAAWKKVQEKKHDIHFSAFGVGAEMYPRYWETWHSVNAWDRAFLENGSINPERKPKTQTNNLVGIAVTELDERIEKYRASEDVRKMMSLAYEMEEILHDYAPFVPGFVTPFYRTANWRWIQWPDDFNVKLSTGPGEYFLAWIDSDMKEETLEARRSGKSFSPMVRVYDQYRETVDSSDTDRNHRRR